MNSIRSSIKVKISTKEVKAILAKVERAKS
jgi:hypothetical protein